MCRRVVVLLVSSLALGGCADRKVVWGDSHGDAAGTEASTGNTEPDDEGDSDTGRTEPEFDIPPEPPAVECDDGEINDEDLCLRDQTISPAGIDPCSVDIADLDGDGHLDVVVPNSDFNHIAGPDNVVTALFGDGRGNVGNNLDYLAGGDVPVGIALGHLDDDGQLDVVSVSHEAGHAAVLRGMGGRDLSSPALHDTGASPSRISIGDLDLDGNQDLVISNSGANSITLLYGVAGGFEPGTFLSNGEPFGSLYDTEIVDLDGNGLPDILLADRTAGLFLARAREVRVFEPEPVDLEIRASSVAAGDLDGDGLVDVAATDQLADGVRLYRGDGTGNLTLCDAIFTDGGPSHLVLDDMNVDGALDVVVANADANTVTVLLGNGDCGVDFSRTFDVGTQPPAIATGDLNEDGVPDIAVANQFDNNVGLILSNP